MNTNLWSTNTLESFWLCQPDIPENLWANAFQRALPTSRLSPRSCDVDQFLSQVLGEGQFGPDHWNLSPAKRWYYTLKPFIPRAFAQILRRVHSSNTRIRFPLRWPTENRYARFQWEVMRQILLSLRLDSTHFINFWPGKYDFSFVLTHDVETGKGQSFIQAVANLEESLGFRSSFNFVISDYTIDDNVVADLKRRGFEVGIHGLRHDNSLFSSLPAFKKQVKIINKYLKKYEAVGFRSPSTFRQPEWMQSLEVDYDLSFFDTDPWEPIPGGTMSIWPFTLGHFIELPYTLAQDNTLVNILKQNTPKIWLEKVKFIKRYHGMVLLNTHPDYLCNKAVWNVYADFLKEMQKLRNYWHALPHQVAHWWRARSNATIENLPEGAVLSEIQLTPKGVKVGHGGVSLSLPTIQLD